MASDFQLFTEFLNWKESQGVKRFYNRTEHILGIEAVDGSIGRVRLTPGDYIDLRNAFDIVEVMGVKPHKCVPPNSHRHATGSTWICPSPDCQKSWAVEWVEK
jgi:hypothetical protein